MSKRDKDKKSSRRESSVDNSGSGNDGGTGNKFSTTWRPVGDYVHLKIQFGSEMYSVSSGYREWSYDGVLRNRNEELQEQRWRSFLAAWHTTFGRFKNKLILGDFNISMLEPQAYPKLKEIIAEYVTSTGCRQLINQPTRVQGTCTPSLLDIIYTNVPDKGIIKIITKFVTISDHLLVGVVLKPVVMSTTCP